MGCAAAPAGTPARRPRRRAPSARTRAEHQGAADPPTRTTHGPDEGMLRDPHRPRPSLDGASRSGGRSRGGDARSRRTRSGRIRRTHGERGPAVRDLHARAARPVLRRAWTAARVRALAGVPGRDVGVDAHRRRSVRGEHGRVPARLLLRPGRPCRGSRHRDGIRRGNARSRAPPWTVLPPDGRAGGRAVPAGPRCVDRHRRRDGRRRLPRRTADIDDVPDADRTAEGRDPSNARARGAAHLSQRRDETTSAVRAAVGSRRS